MLGRRRRRGRRPWGLGCWYRVDSGGGEKEGWCPHIHFIYYLLCTFSISLATPLPIPGVLPHPAAPPPPGLPTPPSYCVSRVHRHRFIPPLPSFVFLTPVSPSTTQTLTHQRLHDLDKKKYPCVIFAKLTVGPCEKLTNMCRRNNGITQMCSRTMTKYSLLLLPFLPRSLTQNRTPWKNFGLPPPVYSVSSSP